MVFARFAAIVTVSIRIRTIFGIRPAFSIPNGDFDLVPMIGVFADFLTVHINFLSSLELRFSQFFTGFIRESRLHVFTNSAAS